MAEIYLAGGCFWGMEKYMASISGVLETSVGYANGNTENPTYEDVCHRNTGHAETVRVVYDRQKVALDFLLSLYYEAIDPVAVNHQVGDYGPQYRTGIYYVDEEDKLVIEASIAALQKNYQEPIAIEVEPLKQFKTAEAYHQKYLDKHKRGYCHIPKEMFEKAANATVNPSAYFLPEEARLKETLTPEQYEVTQHTSTEPPFQNAFFDSFRPGIYVDITTGEPLFSSDDKFESGCGWPSFSKSIDPNVVREKKDHSHGMHRVEVRSRVGDAHLGHVFKDGPQKTGGLRYCINSAALRFIPKEEMEREGYGYLIDFVKS